jgi:hypothetical protein
MARLKRQIAYANRVLEIFDEIPEQEWPKVMNLVILYMANRFLDKEGKETHCFMDGHFYEIQKKGAKKLKLVS